MSLAYPERVLLQIVEVSTAVRVTECDGVPLLPTIARPRNFALEPGQPDDRLSGAFVPRPGRTDDRWSRVSVLGSGRTKICWSRASVLGPGGLTFVGPGYSYSGPGGLMIAGRGYPCAPSAGQVSTGPTNSPARRHPYEDIFQSIIDFTAKLRPHEPQSLDESKVTETLAEPFTDRGLLVLLQEPLDNHPWASGVEEVISGCPSLDILREGLRTVSSGRLSITTNVSVINRWPFLHKKLHTYLGTPAVVLRLPAATAAGGPETRALVPWRAGAAQPAAPCARHPDSDDDAP